MVSRLPTLNKKTGEVADLSDIDAALFKPAAEVLPEQLFKSLVGMNQRRRGPSKAPVKERVTIRLSPEIVQHFKATGAGWQTRIDAALLDWVTQHRS